MALALRRNLTKTDLQNTPSITAVYSQSWPIPTLNFTAKNNSFSSGRSLNKDWVRSSGKQAFESNAERRPKDNNIRAKSASSSRSTKSSLFLNESDDEINDTVQEFKLTLKLFKRLTQQVREVNDYMTTHKIYSFKHHMNNEGIASPALRRSQLAAALSRREIPATQGPNEPITDLGPATLITRTSLRQDRERRVPSPACRSPSPGPPTRPASCLSRVQSGKSTKSTTTEMDRKRETKHRKADEQAKEEWIELDEQFDELFVPDEVEAEDLEFRFHDPYPKNWVDETVEDACFRGSKKVDPFMHRMAELEDVQEETVLLEKLKEDKAKQNSQTQNRIQTGKNTKTHINPNGVRSQSAKSGLPLTRAKTQGNKLARRGSSARNNGTVSNTVSGDETDITTFRKSGYDMDVSFILGSMFPETRPKDKKTSEPEEKPSNGNQKGRAVSAPALPQRNNNGFSFTGSQGHEPRLIRPAYCEACKLKRGGAYKHSCGKSSMSVLRAMRAQYNLKASECYDIVELARTLDYPCKEQMAKAKQKPRPTTAEKASSKGLQPGKSNASQRRISLTAEGMAVRGINPALKFNRPSMGRCKSARKSAKRK